VGDLATRLASTEAQWASRVGELTGQLGASYTKTADANTKTADTHT
jgi:hypothetical protein